MKAFKLLLILPVLSILNSCSQQENRLSPEIAVIPRPQSVTFLNGNFTVSHAARLQFDQADIRIKEAADQVARSIRADIVPEKGKGDIELRIDSQSDMKPAGYQLLIRRRNIRLTARDPAGLFYGFQTLKQLIPADGSGKVPCLDITDFPSFAWRGLMLDCSRTFLPKDYILKYIDRLAAIKMNVLHLHLTDDQGWRIEIRKYPELTRICVILVPFLIFTKLKVIEMRLFKLLFLLGMILLISFGYDGDNLRPERQWGQYRGFMASGVLDHANLPDSFNVAEGKNVKWKITVPGLSLSCPVIWGDHLFLTTAISNTDNSGFKIGMYGDVTPVNDSSVHEWKVYCYNKTNGSLIWGKTACIGVPKIKRHPKSTHANTSIATDGKHVIAFFGSEGLFCYDMQGELKWKADFGILKSAFFLMEQAEWEFASSPILYEGVVIVQCDVLNNPFVAALDAETGKELWRAKREELPGWCTPNIYVDNGKARVVVNGYKHRGAYDFKTGEEIWKMSGGGDIPIPTPIIGDSLIYMNSAHGASYPIMAIRKSAKGDITLKDQQTSGEYVSWYIPKGGSYLATMLLYDTYLYNCNWNGSVICYEAATGKEVYKEKLGKMKSFTGSPVASDGKIYITDEEGNVYVFKAGPEFKLLSANPLGDICMTTPAITDNLIFFRTMRYLFALGK